MRPIKTNVYPLGQHAELRPGDLAHPWHEAGITPDEAGVLFPTYDLEVRPHYATIAQIEAVRTCASEAREYAAERDAEDRERNS